MTPALVSCLKVAPGNKYIPTQKITRARKCVQKGLMSVNCQELLITYYWYISRAPNLVTIVEHWYLEGHYKTYLSE